MPHAHLQLIFPYYVDKKSEKDPLKTVGQVITQTIPYNTQICLE